MMPFPPSKVDHEIYETSDLGYCTYLSRDPSTSHFLMYPNFVGEDRTGFISEAAARLEITW